MTLANNVYDNNSKRSSNKENKKYIYILLFNKLFIKNNSSINFNFYTLDIIIEFKHLKTDERKRLPLVLKSYSFLSHQKHFYLIEVVLQDAVCNIFQKHLFLGGI